MKRDKLEKYQVFFYLAGILLGLLVGVKFSEQSRILEWALWPLLGMLLYTTFTQIPLAHLREAFSDSRFMLAAVIVNFVVLPLIVWGLMSVGPNLPAVKLGILLVLLVPCTDWFITFTHLGGGDTKRAIAFSPVSLLLQLILLPIYIWLFLGSEITTSVMQRELILAFFGLIVLPLLAAFVTEKWAEKREGRETILNAFAWLPVPLLALVVFSIAAAQVNVVIDSLGILPSLLAVFFAFLMISGFLSVVLSKIFSLPTNQGRALAFSLGSRNSFVVLPLALSLSSSFDLAVVVIVFQSLVELFGMAAYIWWVPKQLFRSAT
ncbi:ACR3 family arsenite efflux pump ArsB [Oceanisphaera litoralis]|uniref:arsenic resistance protein n=1 Tax=Oceanisphaera litoralis TaxID=225144 RepID=UPI00195E96FE|nr:arsenic resistance protein [Oceanisphaera litoralis]MBM7454602.1 ACR3 family arsenite efflux pump ArsB [Oceanisphaera litoralis]